MTCLLWQLGGVTGTKERTNEERILFISTTKQYDTGDTGGVCGLCADTGLCGTGLYRNRVSGRRGKMSVGYNQILLRTEL